MTDRFEELVRANYRFGRMYCFSGQDMAGKEVCGRQE